MKLSHNVLKHGYKMFRASVPSLIVGLDKDRLIYHETGETLLLETHHLFADDWVIMEQTDVRLDEDECIMAAACFYKAASKDYLLIGTRHGCRLMHEQIKQTGLTYSDVEEVDDGFITSRGRFISREIAWKIALYSGQIKHRCGGDTINGGHLFSENLW